MSISVAGKEIPTTAAGFLENIEDWSEDVASVIAVEEQVELSDRH